MVFDCFKIFGRCFNKNIDKMKIEDTVSDAELETDYITKCVGPFGWWQLKCCIITSLSSFIGTTTILCIVFLTPATEFICTSFEGNSTREAKQSTCYNDCSKYEFSSKVFHRTVISDFGLICEKEWLASFTQTTVMLGVLFGSPIFGWIADRFGRQLSLRISAFTCTILTIGSSFSPNFYIFNTLRFFAGFASSGVLFNLPMYIIEINGKTNIELISSLVLISNAVFLALLSVFAYISTDWTSYVLNIGLSSILVFALILFLPESPRWLVSKEKVDKAVDLLTTAAKSNNKSTNNIREIINKHIAETKIEKEGSNENILGLFSSKGLAVVTIVLLTIRAASDLIYFGTMQYIPKIGSNEYLDVALLGLIQIPPIFLSIIANKLYGRKPVTISMFFIAGVSMIILVFIPKGHWVCTLLGVVGISTIVLSSSTVYLSTSELFPTRFRNVANGLINCGIGSLVAPFIANLTPQWIPSVIFTVTAFVGCLVVLFLPETKGKDLDEVR